MRNNLLNLTSFQTFMTYFLLQNTHAHPKKKKTWLGEYSTNIVIYNSL